MSFFGRLFGTDAAITKTIDSVSNGLDKLILTDEERLDAAGKERSEARSVLVQWMVTTQGQNLARRLIALLITGVWLLNIVLAQIAGGIAIFKEDPTQFEKLAQLMTAGAMNMNSAVMLILAFYFAAPHMGDIAKAVTGRFTNDINKG